MKEEAITFGAKNSLVGVLTNPSAHGANASTVGAILLNAGIIHHVGPGRIYVKIARQLASQGIAAFRFDFSGIGDSKPRLDNLPFEKSSIDETQRAMDFLEAQLGIRKFILIGGCSGARVSFNTASCDRRVSSCMLINFQVIADEDREVDAGSDTRKDEHYYVNFAVRNYQSWRRLITGQAEYRKVAGVVASRFRREFTRAKSASEPPQFAALRRELGVIINRGVRPIFICSEGDPALDEVRKAGGRELSNLCQQGKMEVVVVRKSDHTFSSLADQELLIAVLREKASEIVNSVPLLRSASRTSAASLDYVQ